jgi:aflatoxin B1 aldehyde reductase
VFQNYGHNQIDTARYYGNGSSEEYLGDANWQGRKLVMATNAYPFGTPGLTHQPDDLRANLLKSLKALKANKVHLYYLHGPDRNTPFEVTPRALNELHHEGYFNQLGISNFMAWEVAMIQEICIRNNWIRPVVYQGLYNAIHRGVEPELFPCLRHYEMSFYAFNPLAGGYLTSRYRVGLSNVEQGSRFDPNTSQGQIYRSRYSNEAMFSALDEIRHAVEQHSITKAECALCWMMHQSKLSKDHGDAIIIGASSIKQLEENLRYLELGPLPDDVVAVLDSA